MNGGTPAAAGSRPRCTAQSTGDCAHEDWRDVVLAQVPEAQRIFFDTMLAALHERVRRMADGEAARPAQGSDNQPMKTFAAADGRGEDR